MTPFEQEAIHLVESALSSHTAASAILLSELYWEASRPQDAATVLMQHRDLFTPSGTSPADLQAAMVLGARLYLWEEGVLGLTEPRPREPILAQLRRAALLPQTLPPRQALTIEPQAQQATLTLLCQTLLSDPRFQDRLMLPPATHLGSLHAVALGSTSSPSPEDQREWSPNQTTYLSPQPGSSPMATLHQHLFTLPPQDVVLALDASSTVMLGDPSALLETYREMGYRVLTLASRGKHVAESPMTFPWMAEGSRWPYPDPKALLGRVEDLLPLVGTLASRVSVGMGAAAGRPSWLGEAKALALMSQEEVLKGPVAEGLPVVWPDLERRVFAAIKGPDLLEDDDLRVVMGEGE